MSKRKEVERMVEQLQRGEIPRRGFVGRAPALGLSLSSVGMLLQACQRKDGGAGKTADSSGAAVADLGPIEKELRYGTPNAAAAKAMKDPPPYPTEDELKRLEYQVDLGKDTATWDQIWTEIKSA